MVEEPSSSGPSANQQLVKEQEDEFAQFQLPFKVATVVDLEQRAYITSEEKAEWLFSRAHAYCKVGTEPGRILRNNMATIQNEMQSLQVPPTEFHYRGKADVQEQQASGNTTWTDHTFESRGFLAMLMWMVKNRALKAAAKVNSLTLLLELASRAFGMADLQRPIMAMVTTPNGILVSKELTFTVQMICYSWADFIRNSPAAASLWRSLGQRCWLNRCISSALETATFLDIWFFLVYIYCHPKAKVLGQNLWLCLGKTFLPEVIHTTGTWLNRYALHLGDEALKILPALRRKTGFVRKLADPVNKLLLLWKLRKEKQIRRRIASTHEELGGDTTRMIRFEAYIDCLMHKKALEAVFEGSKQISIAWDASSYGGKEIMVAVVYDPFKNKASYLMSQQMMHTMVSELSADLIPLARKRKLTRLEGYKEIKGVNSALGSIGLALDDFVVPAGLFVKPLTSDQVRFEHDGKIYIHDIKENTTFPEVPDGLDLGSIPCLVSISDQGPNVIASVNYLQFSDQAILFHAVYDPYHRAWNDIKNALKRSTAGAWRVVLELTLVANINYGPFGSSTWHFKKKSKLQEYLATKDPSSCPLWNKYLHLLCQERRIPEPTNLHDAQDLFHSLNNLETFHTKGPLIKLMRWFSWFESMAFYSGELVATKLILESSLEQSEEGSEKEVVLDNLPVNAKDARQELQALKKRKGSWKLAPELITPRSLAIKDVIMSVAKASWTMFAARARDITSPQHVLEHNISCAHGEFWKGELVDMLHSSLEDARFLHHLQPQFQTHGQVLEWQLDLLEKLLETRACSLTSFHCLPPNLYNHLLAPSPSVAGEAHRLAIEHFQTLLEIEDASNEGADIQVLDHMHWRKNPFIRTLFLAFQEDKMKQQVFTANSCARRLQKVVAQNIGDSRVVENIHQFGKDIFRSSKANTMSNTAIMSSALRSQVLQQNKLDVVTAEVALKATETWKTSAKESVVGSLKNTSKLAPSVQKLMAPKNKQHTWPSPSPASLFQSVAATQWAFKFWSQRQGQFKDFNINAAWPSFLARPSALLAQKQEGRLVKVIASAEFGFLGVDIVIKKGPDDERFYLCRAQRSAIMWHYIYDLDNWADLPVTGCLVNETKGPVGWKRSGVEPFSLPAAACIFGLTMSHGQICRLIRLLGGNVPGGTPAKKVVHELLIDMVVPEEFKEQAKSHIKVGGGGGGPEDGFDTDLSEVVSELAQDDANQQDIKEFKQKKKYHRLKKQLGAEKDEPVQNKRKKPKAKGKAKAKPKAKPNLLNSLLKRARKMRKEKENEEPGMHVDEQAADTGESMADVAPDPEHGGDAPAELASSSAGGPSAPAPPAPAPAPAPAVPARPRHRTDEELMSMLQPPGCKMGISHYDHRFTSIWKYDHSSLGGALGQLRFSRSFAQLRTWKQALEEVHRHNWTKWQKIKLQYPLEPGQEEQVPGRISPDVINQLQLVINDLPALVRYSRSG